MFLRGHFGDDFLKTLYTKWISLEPLQLVSKEKTVSLVSVCPHFCV